MQHPPGGAVGVPASRAERLETAVVIGQHSIDTDRLGRQRQQMQPQRIIVPHRDIRHRLLAEATGVADRRQAPDPVAA